MTRKKAQKIVKEKYNHLERKSLLMSLFWRDFNYLDEVL